MKKTRIFAAVAAASAAAIAMTAAVSAYDLGDKPLGKNWSLNVTIPADAFADLTADNYVTITFTPDADEQEYWSIKPMDSSWTFIDERGEGGPELADGKDAYPVESDWTSITFKVPSDFVDSIKEGGMIIIGHSLVLHEMTISDQAPAAPQPAPSDDGAGSNGDTSAATGDKTNADTGVEGTAVAAGTALLAASAVIISKKRK